MEQPLENRIAEAFHKKDSASSYKKKDELWQKIVLLLAAKKGVATFWRVAAVILALITFGGAFAAITIFENEKVKLADLEKKNRQLEIVIDSLQNVMSEKVTEIKIVEKEKIIYRDVRIPAQKNDNSSAETSILEEEIAQLTKRLNNTSSELQETRASLDSALADLANLNKVKSKTSEEPNQDFRLKPERLKDQMQEIKTEPSPKMKLQFLKVPNENMKYDTNSSLLKK